MIKRIGQAIATQSALQHLDRHQKTQTNIQNSLIQGTRVNNMQDDPSRYVTANHLKAHISSNGAAAENIVAAHGFLNTIDGILARVQENLKDMNRYAMQAANGTHNEKDFALYDESFQKLKDQLDITAQTPWGENQVLTGGVTTATILDTNTKSIAATIGYAYGALDPYSVQVNDMGNTKNVTCTIGGRPFSGSAQSTDTSIALFDAIDPNSQVTLTGLNFKDPFEAKVGIQKIGFNNNFVPFGAMTKALATPLVTNIVPSPNNPGGDYSILYHTEGTNAVFTTQSTAGKVETKISIPDLILKNNTVANNFSGKVVLDDGTELTLSNVDLYQNTLNHTLQSFSYNVKGGYSKTMSVQIDQDVNTVLTMDFDPLTQNGLNLTSMFVSSQDEARTSLNQIKEAIKTVTNLQAKVGAWYNQLNQMSSNLKTLNLNLTQNQSELIDTDATEGISKSQQLEMMIELSMSQLQNIIKDKKKEVEYAIKLQDYR